MNEKIMKGFSFSEKLGQLTDFLLLFTEKFFAYRIQHVTFDQNFNCRRTNQWKKEILINDYGWESELLF